MAGDNEGVKEDFLDSLKDLTFPARPVIQNLTSIAHENVNAAKVIVEAIEIHIAKVENIIICEDGFADLELDISSIQIGGLLPARLHL